MNSYEEKKAARIERMRARADNLRNESTRRLDTAHRIGDAIPMGQPILVGHHSEGRHRRDIARIDTNMRKGIEASKEADALDRRADHAESNRAVSSDDPDAPAKLTAKADKLEAICEKMVAINKLIRRKAPIADLVVMGLTEASAAKLYEPDFCGRIGFAPYQLTNARAEARRARARAEALQTKAEAPVPAPVTFGDVRIVEEENRVRILFPAKPDEATRTRLKSRGFRWSPTSGAWQRHASNGAWYDAKFCVGI